MQAHAVWEAIDPKKFKIKGGRRTDEITLAAIYQGKPEDMLLSISEKTTAKEVWETIKTMCLGADQVKKAKVQTLKADIESLKMKDTEHLDEFYMKLNSLVANIQALGEVIEESYMTRKRFLAQSNYRAEQVLDLIHGDLCGPILPETSGGNKYFLLLVDDYSRAMWVYFLKTKDEAFDAFKKFRAQVERDPDKRVKNFRTNREVTRLETVGLLLELSPKNGWMVHYLDIKSAFLNGDLEEDVYVSRPEGFEKSGQEHLVYKLSKVLYGLCQAPKAWYLKLRKCLESMGLSRCPYEHAVYPKR
ncbi:hypothetical protein AgCh_027143 [Apium graveolens]